METPVSGSEFAEDLSLLKRAAQGDQVAITLLLTRDYSRLHSHLSRRIPTALKSRVDAEDLIQETHVAVFQNLARFESRGPDAWYRWVATIAIRKLRNAIQASRTLKRGGEQRNEARGGGVPGESVVALLDLMAGPEKTPSRHAASRESTQVLEEAILLLPQPMQDAVRLVYLEGHSVEEAAIRLGRSDRAVHNLCHKAKQKLREFLGTGSRFFSRSG